MKLVLDANIIISGLRFDGLPRRIIEVINKGEHAGFTSGLAMAEVEEVLLRKFKVLPPEWVMVSEVLRDTLGVVPTPNLPEVPELRDQRDRHILAAAEFCNADYIISGDNDLLVLGQYENIPIITVNEFIEVSNRPK